MTTTTPTSPLRRAHQVPTDPRLRRHRRDVARWALAHGKVLRRDALAALLGARCAEVGGDPVLAPWTDEQVVRLLRTGVAVWCREHGVDTPPELSATLATYLRYLSAHRLFGPGSHDLGALRRAVAQHRTPDPSRARHPAGAGRAPVLPLA